MKHSFKTSINFNFTLKDKEDCFDFIVLLYEISFQAHKNGIESLNSQLPTQDFLLKKGLKLITEQFEPSEIEKIISRYLAFSDYPSKELFKNLLIRETLLAISRKHPPLLLIEQLKPYFGEIWDSRINEKIKNYRLAQAKKMIDRSFLMIQNEPDTKILIDLVKGYIDTERPLFNLLFFSQDQAGIAKVLMGLPWDLTLKLIENSIPNTDALLYHDNFEKAEILTYQAESIKIILEYKNKNKVRRYFQDEEDAKLKKTEEIVEKYYENIEKITPYSEQTSLFEKYRDIKPWLLRWLYRVDTDLLGVSLKGASGKIQKLFLDFLYPDRANYIIEHYFIQNLNSENQPITEESIIEAQKAVQEFLDHPEIE